MHKKYIYIHTQEWYITTIALSLISKLKPTN